MWSIFAPQLHVRVRGVLFFFNAPKKYENHFAEMKCIQWIKSFRMRTNEMILNQTLFFSFSSPVPCLLVSPSFNLGQRFPSWPSPPVAFKHMWTSRAGSQAASSNLRRAVFPARLLHPSGCSHRERCTDLLSSRRGRGRSSVLQNSTVTTLRPVSLSELEPFS